jgi:hypothetical protein
LALLRLGARPEVMCGKSRTALFVACQYGKPALPRAMLARPAHGTRRLLALMPLRSINY